MHHPPHTVPYPPVPTPPRGPADPASRTEGEPATHLVVLARAARIGFRPLVADCRHNPGAGPRFIAALDHAATPYLVAVEPNNPLLTETGKSPHTVADHPQTRCTSPSRRADPKPSAATAMPRPPSLSPTLTNHAAAHLSSVTHVTPGSCQQSGRRLVQGARERDRSNAMKHRIVVLGAEGGSRMFLPSS